MELFDINPGSKVMVYREKQKKWDRPFMLQWYNNYKTAYVYFGESIVPFSITAVQKYCTESEEQEVAK